MCSSHRLDRNMCALLASFMRCTHILYDDMIYNVYNTAMWFIYITMLRERRAASHSLSLLLSCLSSHCQHCCHCRCTAHTNGSNDKPKHIVHRILLSTIHENGLLFFGLNTFCYSCLPCIDVHTKQSLLLGEFAPIFFFNAHTFFLHIFSLFPSPSLSLSPMNQQFSEVTHVS